MKVVATVDMVVTIMEAEVAVDPLKAAANLSNRQTA